MKVVNIIACVAGAGLCVLSVVMAKTNPNQAKYEEYAAEQLTDYVKANVCNQTPKILERIIKFDCQSLVGSANPQIRQLIAEKTQRQDYLLFSVYSTDLKLDTFIPLPAYEFESVGAFDNFYTYKAQKQ